MLHYAMSARVFGSEWIIYSDTVLEQLESIQASVAKSILGLKVSAPNVSGQVLLGLKPVREVIYRAQLKFFCKVLRLSDERWVKDAMLSHLHGPWKSLYLEYISRVKMEVGMIAGPVSVKHVEITLNHHFRRLLNEKLFQMRLPIGYNVKELELGRHVGECKSSKEISAWLVGQAQLGYKAPRKGYPRLRFCPVCPGGLASVRKAALTDHHVLQECPGIDDVREEQGVSCFMLKCREKGYSKDMAFCAYLRGLSIDMVEIERSDYIKRGAALIVIRNSWLNKWKI